MNPRNIACTLVVGALAFGAPPLSADPGMRVLPVRERATASLQDGALIFKLLKIRGYSIDIRVFGEKRRLNLGQSIMPEDGSCTVVFEEISPETRIARFRTDCS